MNDDVKAWLEANGFIVDDRSRNTGWIRLVPYAFLSDEAAADMYARERAAVLAGKINEIKGLFIFDQNDKCMGLIEDDMASIDNRLAELNKQKGGEK